MWCVFFFKQKTAYEMRSSDWSSDVCSSDLRMIEFYPQIKMFHIALALLSGGLFALRGAGVLAGMRWPHWLAVRWTSYAIDTSLLTAALMLPIGRASCGERVCP